jgi:hypothetical protein
VTKCMTGSQAVSKFHLRHLLFSNLLELDVLNKD